MSVTDFFESFGYEEGRYSDITVSSLDKDFKLHKLVICRSPYFRAMLSSPQWTESSLEVVDIPISDPVITVDALDVVFRSLYSPNDFDRFKSRITTQNQYGILATCAMLLLDDWMNAAVDVISSKFCFDNILEAADMSRRYMGTHLSEAVRHYLAVFLPEIFLEAKETIFFRLPLPLLAEVLSSDSCSVFNEFRRYVMAREYTINAISKTCTLWEGAGPPSDTLDSERLDDSSEEVESMREALRAIHISDDDISSFINNISDVEVYLKSRTMEGAVDPTVSSCSDDSSFSPSPKKKNREEISRKPFGSPMSILGSVHSSSLMEEKALLELPIGNSFAPLFAGIRLRHINPLREMHELRDDRIIPAGALVDALMYASRVRADRIEAPVDEEDEIASICRFGIEFNGVNEKLKRRAGHRPLTLTSSTFYFSGSFWRVRIDFEEDEELLRQVVDFVLERTQQRADVSDDVDFVRESSKRHPIRFKFLVLRKYGVSVVGDMNAVVEFSSADLVGLATFEKMTMEDFFHYGCILDGDKLRVVLVCITT